MSSSQFSSESGQYDDTEIVTIYDEEGRPLDCYVENEIDYQGKTYVLLMPIDLTIVILTEETSGDDDYVETLMVEDSLAIDALFDDAKAVLGELNLFLKRTGFILTASGELPPLEENNIIALELEEDNLEIEAEELQFLASFYYLEQKYNICTPLTPLMLVGERNSLGDVKVIHADEEDINWILEDLMFEDYDDN
jgi:hypothetical protein